MDVVQIEREGQETGKEVFLLFSGGRDSMLSAARLIADGNVVHLVTFNCGCIKDINNRQHGAGILIEKYNVGDIKAVIDHGIVDICGIWQMLLRSVDNESFTAMQDYSAMSMSQTHCLVCRTAMVVSAAILCKSSGLSVIAVGDKQGDLFAAQHTKTYDIHSSMLKEMFEIEYIRPVWDVNDTFETKSELMMRGLPTKVIEPQCVLGCPMELSSGNVDPHLADDNCVAIYSKLLYPVIEKAKDSWAAVLKL